MKSVVRAFTLIELLVVISIIALLIAILLPALGAARETATLMQSSTQLRGIHQGMVIYAQDNKQWFPGWNPGQGQWEDAGWNAGWWKGDNVQPRFAALLSNDYVTGEYLISPAEPYGREAFDYGTWDGTQANRFDQINYSFAMLEVSSTNPNAGVGNKPSIQREWNVDSMNSESLIVGDRILDVIGDDFGNMDAYIGIYSKRPGMFKFGATWNDGHTTFENSPLAARTSYGKFTSINDNVYVRGSQGYTNDADIQTSPTPTQANDGFVDAMLIYRGRTFLQSNLPGE